MYHIRGKDGTAHGPVDRATLDAWIAEKRVRHTTLVHGGASAEWLPLSRHPDFAPTRPARRIPARVVAIAGAGVLGLVLLLALAAAALPLARSGRWELLPDVVLGGLRGDKGDIPHPAAPVRSDASKVREEPIDGIRIRADAGALDEDRTFTAEPLGAKQMAEADRALRDQQLIALGGYDIDCGMSEEDLFLEPVTISLDLGKLGIPEPLHSEVGVANIADDGTAVLVPSHLKGDTLSFEARHNGGWLPVLVPLFIGTAKLGLWVDRACVPKGDYFAAYWPPAPGTERYRMLYPPSWPSPNPKEVKRVEGVYERLIRKHRLTAAELKIRPGESQASSGSAGIAVDPLSDLEDLGKQLADRMQRLSDLYSDPEFISMRDGTVRSEKWMKDNFLPRRVSNTVICLDRGWDYLQSRGFRKPGIAKYQMYPDVYIVEQSLGAELYAEVHNTWTTSPFIVFDGTKIPDVEASSFDAAQKKAFDALQMTAMHELFHTVQAAYVFMERNRYLWFNEAAAVVLEGEAQKYYVNDKRYAESWDMTKRSYAAFLEPMQYFHSEESRPNQQHGYGEAYFFEFLRDRYFTTEAARDGFLPALYEDFAKLRGSDVECLYRTTSGSPEKFSADFEAFTHLNADAIDLAYRGSEKKTDAKDAPAAGTAAKKPKADSFTPLGAKNPVRFLRFAPGGKPLGADCMVLAIEAPDTSSGAAKPDEPVYVLSTNGVEEHGAVVRVQVTAQGGGDWREVKGGGLLPRDQRFVPVLRTETYLEQPDALRWPPGGAGADVQGPVAFVMLPPEKPEAQVDDQSVRIDWPTSAAADVVRSDGSRVLISGWRVTLTMPDGRSTTFRTDEPSVNMPLKTLDKLMAADKQASKNQLFRTLHGIGQADMITLINISEALSAGDAPKVKVTVREVAAVPGAPLGPVSEVGEFEYGDEERTIEDITGTWTGRVPFSEGALMRLDISQQGGGDFLGTMHWGSDAMPIRGSWDPKTKSWAIDMREDGVWMPMFMLAKGRLQKLPGAKLYLYAPPALLSRMDERDPDLGWQPEEGDQEIENILQQLQMEMEQTAPSEGSTP